MSSKMNGIRKTRNVLVATRRKRKDEQEVAAIVPSSEVVNDLEIAHKYASVSSCFSALDLGKTASSAVDLKISTSVISSKIVDYSSSSEEEEEGPDSVSQSNGSSGSSDNESDLDWTEELTQMDPEEMIDEDEPIDGGSSRNRNNTKDRNHPKAKCGNKTYYYHHYLNQIDATQLQPDAQFLPKKDDVIELVGNVKSHIIGERVIVVESLSYGSRGKPLGEGNVLLLSKTDVVDEDITNDTSGSSDRFFPLGAICEVFGPVSRPLYTVQLPLPVCKPYTNGEKNTTALMIPQTVEENTLTEDPILTPDSHNDICNKGQAATTTVQEREEDPWSETGLHTLKLFQRRQNNLIPVYCERKRAVWVDTHAIIEQSGRGCDVNEEDEKETVEFSDDEAERQHYSSLTKQRTQEPQQKHQSLHHTNNANRISGETTPRFMHNSSFNANPDRRTTRKKNHSNPHTGSLGISHLQRYPQYQHVTTGMNPPQLIIQPTDPSHASNPSPIDAIPITSATRSDFEADTVYYQY